jgi:hypothetical protein
MAPFIPESLSPRCHLSTGCGTEALSIAINSIIVSIPAVGDHIITMDDCARLVADWRIPEC